MISQDDFSSADPNALYAQMRPDQRTAIANEFVRHLTLAGDPAAAEFARAEEARLSRAGRLEMAKQGFDALPPELESVDHVASLHTYTRDHHPDLFDKVAQHPVTVASLAHPGVAVEGAVQQEEVIVQAPPSDVEANDPDLRKTANLYAAEIEPGLAEQRAREVLSEPDEANRTTDPGGHDVLERAQEERP